MLQTIATTTALTVASALLARKLMIRLRLSRAKHPSLRGHAKWSRRLSRQVAGYSFDSEQFFRSDNALPAVAGQRRAGLNRLTQSMLARSPLSISLGNSLEQDLSDAAFTCAYRVPFPYRDQLPKVLRCAAVVKETAGVQVCDLDGNWRYDLSGSYGVNVFGYDFYKSCIEEGTALVRDLGPVLGAYHPLVRDNVDRLKTISGLDDVSFHMSGTEAVMQAVRLARYHTGKTHLVRFCGAYHGWWDGVQPGIGNQRRIEDVYTLRDVSDQSLKVLQTRNDIACVLINPLQALHPNADAASDSSLVNSTRRARFDRSTYTRWLERLRDTCSRKGIVLILDEVFTGFRLEYRGAQGYFNIQADMVTYGKSLGGGLPVGVLCGRHELMQRFKPQQPVNVSLARGTFNSHPYVLGAMNVFLRRIAQPYYQDLYQKADAVWNARIAHLNDRLRMANLPVQVANLHTVCTVIYQKPSRYNWMFQFYLRDQGLELSWVGSGRMIMSLNFSNAEFDEVMDRFVKAARRMSEDGWWWQSPELTTRKIQQQLLIEMLRARFCSALKGRRTRPQDVKPAQLGEVT